MLSFPASYLLPIIIGLSTLIILLPKFINNKKFAKNLSIACICLLLIACILAVFGCFN